MILNYEMTKRMDTALELAERWVKTREQEVKLREQELKASIARVKGRGGRVLDKEHGIDAGA